jgi:hypothetical protein
MSIFLPCNKLMSLKSLSFRSFHNVFLLSFGQDLLHILLHGRLHGCFIRRHRFAFQLASPQNLLHNVHSFKLFDEDIQFFQWCPTLETNLELTQNKMDEC